MQSNQMLTTWADELPQGDELRRVQIISFARQTPINSFVTISVSLLSAIILWPVAPRFWVTLWAGSHILLSLIVLIRWSRHRGQTLQHPISPGVLRKAAIWALLSGSIWGSSVAFLPIVPPTQQLALIIVMAAMAGGASTTLAAIPQAATLFILSCILPGAFYFIWQADPAYVGLAALALVMATAMLASTRVVYGAISEEMKAKQASAALLAQFYAERQEWLEISETTEAFALFDAHNNLLLWNDSYQRILNLSPTSLFRGAKRIDILRQCSSLITHETETENLDTWIDTQLHMHEHPDVPLIQKLADGRWLQSKARQTAQGNFISIYTDITDRKEAEDERESLSTQLHQAQKMEALGTLAGGIAHEFNNTLSAILGFSDLIRYEEPPGSRTSQHIREVLAAGHRAKDLVQQILAFSRGTSVERSPQPLHLIVQQGLPLLYSSLPSSITIRHNCEVPVGNVLANATQVQQVVMNLCTNAEHAMRYTGGEIDIELDTVGIDTTSTAEHPHLLPGPYARLTVRDTGHGMSPSLQGRIFDPFFTTKEYGAGTGMGLAIVHGIVRDHGGAITVSSTPDIGTTFRVYLPQIESAPTAPADPHPSPPHGSGRILFVDDEGELVRMTQKMLTHLGYDVCAVNRSQDALARFRAAPHDFDLVITDQTMPDITGDRLTQELRQLRPDIPVILCTGFSHVMDEAKALALGIDAFLFKPLVLNDLALAIRKVLNKQRAQPTLLS